MIIKSVILFKQECLIVILTSRLKEFDWIYVLACE
jgi:hypothetical protein